MKVESLTLRNFRNIRETTLVPDPKLNILVGKNGNSGTHAMAREVIDRIHRGGRVVVFPEGTRSPDDRVRPFGAGAFRLALMANCPLVPVAMSGSADVVAKGSRLLRPAKVRIAFLEPRVLTEEESRSQEYRESVKKNMPRKWFDDLPHTHVALDDAKGQGALFCNMLAARGRLLG